MALFLSFLSSFITPHCYSLLFDSYDFSDSFCLSLLFSKSISLCIILGSILVKVPQLINIIRAKSGAGLDLYAIALGMITYSISFGYNVKKGYPVSSYGENMMLLVQDAWIMILCMYYSNELNGMFWMACAGFGSWLGALAWGSVSGDVLDVLKVVSIPMFSFSRVIQIRRNYLNGSTGQLSAITLLLQFGGSAARVLTTLAETKDTLELLGYVAGVATNGILLFQIFYYARKSEKKET